MSNITVNYSGSGGWGPLNSLQGLIECDGLEWGTEAGYQLCKQIFVWHPLGWKIAAGPVKTAMSRPRTMIIDDPLETELRTAFDREWKMLKANQHIRATAVQSRIYGVAALAYGGEKIPTNEPINPWNLQNIENFYLKTFDPLNLAGSLVFDQNPNAIDFQSPAGGIASAGQPWHKSRAVVVMNEFPIYLEYSSPAFGFSGRSVYARALYPLRSYLFTMQADQMVARKSGLLIAMMEQSGSIVGNLMAKAGAMKRSLLQQSGTDQVLTIGKEEKIESINLTNVNDALTASRKNILEDIAASIDAPARLITQETYSTGLANGDQDAAEMLRFINSVREELESLYDEVTRICQHRAWSSEFFDGLQAKYPELKSMTYEQAFYQWRDATKFTWPDLSEEPQSEKVKRDEIVLRGLTELLRTMLPACDPENRARLFEWVENNVNQMPDSFRSNLLIDLEAIALYEPPTPIPAAPEPNQL